MNSFNLLTDLHFSDGVINPRNWASLEDFQRFVWISKKGDEFVVVDIDHLTDTIRFRKTSTNEIGSISQWDFLHVFDISPSTTGVQS
ncbi:MAG: hypothetical protein ACTSYI_11960 [Promethearchaeota archaeon]